jgi:hypothetical protein
MIHCAVYLLLTFKMFNRLMNNPVYILYHIFSLYSTWWGCLTWKSSHSLVIGSYVEEGGLDLLWGPISLQLNGYRRSLSGTKWQRHDTDHSPPHSGKVKVEWCTSIAAICHHGSNSNTFTYHLLQEKSALSGTPAWRVDQKVLQSSFLSIGKTKTVEVLKNFHFLKTTLL